MILFLLGAAALSLGLKAAYFASDSGDSFLARQQAEVDGFLLRHGWRRVGDAGIDVTGIIQAGRYRGEACPAELRVLLLDPTGDMAGIARDLAGDADTLFYVHDGAVSAQPPAYAPFRQAVGRVAQSLRLALLHVPPYLAVAAPAACGVKDALPWADLQRPG